MISGIGSSASQLDRTEMAKNMFKKLDANQDGGIDASELAVMAKDGKGPSAEEILSKWDANKDGVIDEDENKTAMESAPPPPPDGARGASSADGKSKLFEELLKQFDSDTDGKISSEEFKVIQQQMELGSSYSSSGTSKKGSSESLIDILA